MMARGQHGVECRHCRHFSEASPPPREGFVSPGTCCFPMPDIPIIPMWAKITHEGWDRVYDDQNAESCQCFEPKAHED